MWDTLFTLFDLYGPIPRLLFETLLPPFAYDGLTVSGVLKRRMDEYGDLLHGKIVEAVKLDPNIALSTEYGVNCSHTIYTMRPWKIDDYKYVSDRPAYGFATADIGRRIAEATIAVSLKDAQRLYDFLLGQGVTKTSAGWVFETRMHQIFQRGGHFVATKHGGSTTITIDIDSCSDFSQVSGVGDMLRERPRSQRINPDIIGRYFKPQRCNLPSVDSFAVRECATTEDPVLVLFQMTVSTEHPVKEPPPPQNQPLRSKCVGALLMAYTRCRRSGQYTLPNVRLPNHPFMCRNGSSRSTESGKRRGRRRRKR